MSVIPTKDLDAVQFFEVHDPIWAVAPATIGLTGACHALESHPA